MLALYHSACRPLLAFSTTLGTPLVLGALLGSVVACSGASSVLPAEGSTTDAGAGGGSTTDGSGTDGADAASTKARVGLAVFTTKAVFDGNLGGLLGADAKCTVAAKAAGRAGKFRAWLSDSTANANRPRSSRGRPVAGDEPRRQAR